MTATGQLFPQPGRQAAKRSCADAHRRHRSDGYRLLRRCEPPQRPTPTPATAETPSVSAGVGGGQSPTTHARQHHARIPPAHDAPPTNTGTNRNMLFHLRGGCTRGEGRSGRRAARSRSGSSLRTHTRKTTHARMLKCTASTPAAKRVMHRRTRTALHLALRSAPRTRTYARTHARTHAPHAHIRHAHRSGRSGGGQASSAERGGRSRAEWGLRDAAIACVRGVAPSRRGRMRKQPRNISGRKEKTREPTDDRAAPRARVRAPAAAQEQATRSMFVDPAACCVYASTPFHSTARSSSPSSLTRSLTHERTHARTHSLARSAHLLTSQLVAVEVKHRQLRQLPHVDRDAACQTNTTKQQTKTTNKPSKNQSSKQSKA